MLKAIQYYTILYYTILYYTILYYTILYYTILYYTILYYTTPSFATNSMHPRNWVLREKLIVFQIVKKFPLFHGIPRFITAFAVCPPLVHVLSQIIPIHHPYTTLLLSPGRLFSLGLPIKTLYAPPLFSVRSTSPAHLILLYLITRIIFSERP